MKDNKLVEEVKKEAEKRELDFVSVIKLAIEAGRKAGIEEEKKTWLNFTKCGHKGCKEKELIIFCKKHIKEGVKEYGE